MDGNAGIYGAVAVLAAFLVAQKLRNRKASPSVVGEKLRAGGLADMPS
jgi:hypothetical protein